MAGGLKFPLQQDSIKVSCLPKRVIICLRTLVQNGPAFVQHQADQHWDMMLPGSHWLPTCAKSKCLPCICELGKKKKKKPAMKQLNKLAGTASPAAALLKTHLQRPRKTLRPGLITCHGSSGANPSSCPQASAGPGRDKRAAPDAAAPCHFLTGETPLSIIK